MLLLEKEKQNEDAMLVNEEKVTPKLADTTNGKRFESNLWYLDNGASNHMTGQRSKFKVLDENASRQVKFGYGSLVHIKGKRSIILKCKIGRREY